MLDERTLQSHVVQEIAEVQLGDERRNRRARSIAARLAAAPAASLPESMGTRAATEGLYRHLSSDEVSLEALLAPHFCRTSSRVGRDKAVFAVSDTTEFQFGGEKPRKELGPINTRAQGFLAHVVLAVSADGTRRPLGLLDVQTWARKGLKNTRRSAKNSASRNDPSRESMRWEKGMRSAAQRTAPASLIHVADRDSDMYDLLAGLQASGDRYIIRAAQNRALESRDGEPPHQLFPAARASEPIYSVDVPISARPEKKGRPPALRKKHPKRGCRTAHLCISARRVRLRRPQHCGRSHPEAISSNIIHVFEPTPPPGEQRVEWFLLTSEPIHDKAAIEFVVQGYRTRWVVEEFFKAVKTGCAFEARQLESFGALTALLGLVCVIAYSLLLMRNLVQHGGREAASVVVTPQQLALLRAASGLQSVDSELCARDVLLLIAALGGHLQNNEDPGWQVLSRGWRRLLEYEAGYVLMRTAKCDQS